MSNRARVSAIFLMVVACFLGSTALASAPDRFREHVEKLTADGGTWVASNSRYQNEREPFDAYKLVWRQGIGGPSAYGVMTALRGLEETDPIWQFVMYWDPASNQARLLQFSSSDIVGTGTMTIADDGSEETTQTFFPANGEPYQVRHTATIHGNVHETTSFKREGGEWKRNRTYAWVRRGAIPPAAGDQP